MAVHKSKRHKSPILFLLKLKEIELDVFRFNMDIPKKYRPFNEKYIINPIASAYSYATIGNTYFIKYKDYNALKYRETYFNKSIDNLLMALSQIEIVIEMQYKDSVSNDKWLIVSSKINECIDMIKHILQSDKIRVENYDKIV